MKIWMTVTNDKYEFPVIIEESIEELAEKTGKATHTIRSAISHAKMRGGRCQYHCVEVEDDEDDGKG